MLSLNHISYIHPDKTPLFTDISFTLNSRDKIAMIGNNGSGKSTLLKIIAGELSPTAGAVSADSRPYYVPQIFGQFDHLTIAEALGIDRKLHALHQILAGNATEDYFSTLQDDWTVEERCRESLSYWDLPDLDPGQKLSTLSGGQKTKVFLAGIAVSQARFILLDEPSNHLDLASRQLLYTYIGSAAATLLVVSHDRKLLNLLNRVAELGKNGITMYGGNYDFYSSQKSIELDALSQDVRNREKALRQAKEKEREAINRQNKLDARGKKKQEKAGVARIMMNTLKNNAENSTAKLKGVHSEKLSGIRQELQDLRASIPDIDKMKFGLESSDLHTGKLLFSASGLHFAYDGHSVWNEDLNFELRSGERVWLKGPNGSGKTTLIRILLSGLQPQKGVIKTQPMRAIYIDQEYSVIDDQLNVYEQAQAFNDSALQEHEIKIRLNRFLFGQESWNKPCSALSGGEKMRLMLCCLTIGGRSPDLIVLDEPTNNLDMQNIDIMIAAVNAYRGTLVLVSHDEHFVDRIKPGRTVELR